jgi:hypothetical protein
MHGCAGVDTLIQKRFRMSKTDSAKPIDNGPFKVGDKVFCHKDSYAEQGIVVDVWEIPFQDGSLAWLVTVDHGEFEYAYMPSELSLIPKESNNKVVYANFKTKRWLKETT